MLKRKRPLSIASSSARSTIVNISSVSTVLVITDKFIESSVAAEVSDTVEELAGYIKGGDKALKEAYGHIPKPKARKIKDYLYSILEDAWRYHHERKPGRKPGSKNKKKRAK